METPLLKPPGLLLAFFLAMLSMIGLLFMAALGLVVAIIGLMLYLFFIRKGG